MPRSPAPISPSHSHRERHSSCQPAFSGQHSIWGQNGHLQKPPKSGCSQCLGDSGEPPGSGGLGLNTRKQLPKGRAGQGCFGWSQQQTQCSTQTGSLLWTAPLSLPRLGVPATGKGLQRAEKTCVCAEFSSVSCPCDSSTPAWSSPNS